MSAEVNIHDPQRPFIDMPRYSWVRGSRRIAAVGVALAMLVLAMALWAAGAQADYEQVKEGSEYQHFGVSGEAQQLANATAVAVNTSGAGGVEAGSLYVVGRNDRVVRYGPGKEGEAPPFREAWGWGAGDGSGEFQRCGPALATEPVQHTFQTCLAAPGTLSFGGEESGHFETPSGVAVDQTTGDVYIFNETNLNHREHHLIEVFTATGSPVGAGFGDSGRQRPEPSESIAEGPEKMHENGATISGIAVDGAGTVYVTDLDWSGIANPPGEARVMCFRPTTPGDYENYEYCGQSADITSTRSQQIFRIALVGSASLVAGSAELIRQYPLGGGSTPVCTYHVPQGNLEAMTANPVTGEVFYFTPKNRQVHRLGACDAGTGKFKELQEGMLASPETNGIIALAVNPSLAWGELRPEGVLYGADQEEHLNLSPAQLGVGDVFAPAKVFEPAIEAESVVQTTISTSGLRAQINPHGFSTRYSFQYLPEAVYLIQEEAAEREGRNMQEVAEAAFVGAGVAPAGGGQVGSSGVGVATAALAGLAPDASYRFRVIATSECNGAGEPVCETIGAATSFHTFPNFTMGLPDGRAYELVSPAQKYGGEVFPADLRIGSCIACKPPGNITVVFPMQSAGDGDAVAFMGYPFSSGEGAAVFNSYLSHRTAQGWQTTAQSPGLLATKSGSTLAYSAGLDEALLSQEAPHPQLSSDAPSGYTNFYLQQSGDPSALQALVTVRPPHRTELGFVMRYAGHSLDFSRQFFTANDALTAETPYAPAPPDPGQTGSDLYEWRAGRLVLVNVLPGNAVVAAGAAFASQSPDTNAISTDGRRVYFTAGSSLYVREDGEVTREVRHPGHFLTASPDGMLALLSDGCLYSLASERCTDLSAGEGGFQGIAGQSTDLSHIYFIDTKILPGSGENDRHETPQSGKDNLYLWQKSIAAAPRYITTLTSSDSVPGVELVDWAQAPGERTAEASPDGEWLAFVSRTPLTGYEKNTINCPQTVAGETVPGPCIEVFVYSAATGRLACASCNPTDEAPLGNSTLRRIYGAEEREWLPQPRYLTDAGRLFFDSSDRLSSFDTNGRVEDVYEAEPAGVGSCVRVGGCVFLISPGTGLVDSNFLAMDENGANVFFTTRERLVPQDTDELIDLYDARVDGGLASVTEARQGECQGEACQTAPTPPVFTTPGSALGAYFSPPPTATTITGSTSKPPSPQTQPLTRARKLTQALRACRNKRLKRRRVACEKQARNRYLSVKSNASRGGKAHA